MTLKLKWNAQRGNNHNIDTSKIENPRTLQYVSKALHMKRRDQGPKFNKVH